MLSEKYYHIYTHANGSENLFREDQNYFYFLNLYQKYILPVAETLSWCLMPNHLHALVQVKSEEELAKFFKNKLDQDLTGFENLSGLVVRQFSHLFNAYAKAYNKLYQRRGSLFIRAYKRKEISSDHYLSNVIHYIHHNPVHHGFVKHPADWPWSSYQNILNSADSFIARQQIIQWFGSVEAYQQFHEQNLSGKHLAEIEMNLQA
ncbi:MAG TPA: hypothetical protein PKC24_03705 [Cyclobacteriaceae bacterium]|nr:hypothetical protein [Cyclobacteriaceae bacterium]